MVRTRSGGRARQLPRRTVLRYTRVCMQQAGNMSPRFLSVSPQRVAQQQNGRRPRPSASGVGQQAPQCRGPRHPLPGHPTPSPQKMRCPHVPCVACPAHARIRHAWSANRNDQTHDTGGANNGVTLPQRARSSHKTAATMQMTDAIKVKRRQANDTHSRTITPTITQQPIVQRNVHFTSFWGSRL